MPPVPRTSRALRGLFIAVAIAIVPQGVSATEQPSATSEFHQGGVKHAEVAEPKTFDEAMQLFKASLAAVEGALAAPDIAVIHQATYALEAAAKRIGEEPGHDSVKDSVAPRIEIVHLASELGDADTIRSAVPALVKAARDALPKLRN